VRVGDNAWPATVKASLSPGSLGGAQIPTRN